jgi:hypothetical protein
MSEDPRKKSIDELDGLDPIDVPENKNEEKTSEDDLMQYLHRNRVDSTQHIGTSTHSITQTETRPQTSDILELNTFKVEDRRQSQLEALAMSTNTPEARLFLSTLDQQRIMTPSVTSISSPRPISNQTDALKLIPESPFVVDATSTEIVQTLTQLSYPVQAASIEEKKICQVAPTTQTISPEFIVRIVNIYGFHALINLTARDTHKSDSKRRQM